MSAGSEPSLDGVVRSCQTQNGLQQIRIIINVFRNISKMSRNHVKNLAIQLHNTVIIQGFLFFSFFLFSVSICNAN